MDFHKLHRQVDDISRYYYKMEEALVSRKEATGEVKNAFTIIANDYLWKVTQAMDRLQNEIIRQRIDNEGYVLGTTIGEDKESERCDAKDTVFNKPVFITYNNTAKHSESM